KDVRARVAGAEAETAGQYGLAVSAREVDRAVVAGGCVAERIQGSDREVASYARGGGRREAGYHERAGCSRRDDEGIRSDVRRRTRGRCVKRVRSCFLDRQVAEAGDAVHHRGVRGPKQRAAAGAAVDG